MILPPQNDVICLGQITTTMRDLVDAGDRTLAALARELGSTAALVRWIRSLPQRDDNGAVGDGPKVAACVPPQRLRVAPADPNCVERAALYLAVAELLDPGPRRWLDTIRTEVGLHTLPLENGRAVVLDPRVTRNEAQAAVDLRSGALLPTAPAASAAWVYQVAVEPARLLVGGERALRNARAGLGAVTHGASLPRPLVDDVALVLALAEREATRWGSAGAAVVDRVTRRLAAPVRAPITNPIAVRNAIGHAVRHYRLHPDVSRALRAVARTLVEVTPAVAVPAAQAALTSLGVTPALLGPVERALNREGLTLGPLARPISSVMA